MSSPTGPFVAWIIPWQIDAHPEHPIVLPPEQPPVEGAPPHPAHPIVLPPAYPAHPIFIPGYPAHPIVLPPGDQPHPEHPIVIPKPPVEGAHPEHPIYLPPVPAHPIVLPDPPATQPPGGEAGSPEHPINLPPGPNTDKGYWAQAFFPPDSWVWVWVPTGNEPPHPEQGKRGRK